MRKLAGVGWPALAFGSDMYIRAYDLIRLQPHNASSYQGICPIQTLSIAKSNQQSPAGASTPPLPTCCISALHTSTCVLGVDNRICYPLIPGIHLLNPTMAQISTPNRACVQHAKTLVWSDDHDSKFLNSSTWPESGLFATASMSPLASPWPWFCS